MRTTEPWTVEPPGEDAPDLIVLPASVEPWTWMFPLGSRQPIWQNAEVAVYAPNGTVARITPSRAVPEAPPVAVEVADARIDDGRIVFATTFDDRAPERWTGQDWVIVELDDGPWPLPARFLGDGRGPEVAKWFDGLISSGSATGSHTYEFDVPTARLAVRNDAGAFVPLDASEGDLGAGSWVLALRLRHEWQPNIWREVAFIPVLEITISDTGQVTFAVFDDVGVETMPPGTPATP